MTILISARWSATTFSFLTGQVSFPCSMLLRTQLLYNLPLIIKDTCLLVSSGTSCLNLFQPIRILASTAASAYPSTLSMSPTIQIYAEKNIFDLISHEIIDIWQTRPFSQCQAEWLNTFTTAISIRWWQITVQFLFTLHICYCTISIWIKNYQNQFTIPSVISRCWLGGRKGIRPVENWVVGCWRGYLCGARCRLAYGAADATATHSLAWVKSRLVLPFRYQHTRVVPDKGPLNICMCVCVLTDLFLKQKTEQLLRRGA